MDLSEWVEQEESTKAVVKGDKVKLSARSGDPRTLLVEAGLDPAEWQIEEIEYGSKGTNVTATPRIVRGPVLSHTLQIIRAVKDPSPKTIIVSDHQIPKHDRTFHRLFLAYLALVKPWRLGILGDALDNASTSRHLDAAVRESLSETITEGHAVFADYREACGSETEMWYIPGNHEHNLTKTLLSKVPMLFGVRAWGAKYPAMSIPGLLGLEELDIEWIGDLDANEYPLARVEVAPNCFAYHGWNARKMPGASALSAIEHVDYSFIQGHTHRLATVRKTIHTADGLRILYAVENGTMCQIIGGLGWTNNPDWQNGFTEITHVGDDYHISQIAWNGGPLIAPPYCIWEEDGEICYSVLHDN